MRVWFQPKLFKVSHFIQRKSNKSLLRDLAILVQLFDIWHFDVESSQDQLLLVVCEPSFVYLVDHFDSDRAKVIVDWHEQNLPELLAINMA